MYATIFNLLLINNNHFWNSVSTKHDGMGSLPHSHEKLLSKWNAPNSKQLGKLLVMPYQGYSYVVWNQSTITTRRRWFLTCSLCPGVKWICVMAGHIYVYIYICMLLIIFRFMWEHETPLSRKDALLLSRCFWVCWGAWLAMNSPASSLALRPAPHDLALSLLVRAPGGFVGSDIARPSGELLVSGMRCTHIDMLILMMMMMMMTTTTAIHISYSNSPK